MIAYGLPLLFVALVFASIVFLNERFGLLAGDRFPSRAAKIFAYAWLGFFMLLLALLITASSMNIPTAKELAKTPFYSLFGLHFVLMVFLLGWWLATGRPRIREFLSIKRENAGEAVLTGFGVGVAGWMFTILMAVLVAGVLSAFHLMPVDSKPSPMISFIAAMALWKKIVIVLSAMTVEEAFFRGFLQKRIGLVASTLLFALAHSGFGQPLLLIGVTIISLVIGYTFYRTKNLIPGVIAHGVFDAIQLFVIIPIVFKATGMG